MRASRLRLRIRDVGRRAFTSAELDEIRRLLREKGTASADRQKAIRGQLRRKFDFYITDFTDRADGFVASDLDDLIERGTIEVTGPTSTSSD
jgi:hypothetical protein